MSYLAKRNCGLGCFIGLIKSVALLIQTPRGLIGTGLRSGKLVGPLKNFIPLRFAKGNITNGSKCCGFEFGVFEIVELSNEEVSGFVLLLKVA